jgi:hypothetical protein
MLQVNVAVKDCIQRLDEQFPKSPRVEVLQGQRIEAQDLNLATKYYESLLDSDETNVVRTLIPFDLCRHLTSLFRQHGSVLSQCYDSRIR